MGQKFEKDAKKDGPAQGRSRRIDEELIDLASDLTPDELHAQYLALTNETLDQTQARRMLMRACLRLRRTSELPTLIAEQVGFPSYTVFCEKFFKFLDMTPEEYRERGRQLASETGQTFDTLYRPDVRRWPAIRVAFLRHYGSYIEQGTVMERLYGWAALHGVDYRKARRFSLLHDDPMVVPTAALSSDCCIEVPPNVVGDAEVRIMDIPQRRRVSVVHKGPYAELDQAIFWLTRWWLPQSGERRASGMLLVNYLQLYTGIPSQWETEMAMDLEDED